MVTSKLTAPSWLVESSPQVPTPQQQQLLPHFLSELLLPLPLAAALLCADACWLGLYSMSSDREHPDKVHGLLSSPLASGICSAAACGLLSVETEGGIPAVRGSIFAGWQGLGGWQEGHTQHSHSRKGAS